MLGFNGLRKDGMLLLYINILGTISALISAWFHLGWVSVHLDIYYGGNAHC